MYELEQIPLTYAKGVTAPYLVDCSDKLKESVDRMRARAETIAGPAAPPVGIAIVRPNRNDFVDLTMDYHGVVATMSDFRGPKAIDLYEDDCTGCKAELSQLKLTAQSLRISSGVLVIVSAESIKRSRVTLATTDPKIPVVGDNHHSIYAAFGVRTLPLTYFITPKGKIADVSVGNMSDSDVAYFMKELHDRGKR